MLTAIRYGNQRVLGFLLLLLFVGGVQAWTAGNSIAVGSAAGLHFGWLALDAVFVGVLEYHVWGPDGGYARGATAFLIAGLIACVLVAGSTYFAAGHWPNSIAWSKVLSWSVE